MKHKKLSIVVFDPKYAGYDKWYMKLSKEVKKQALKRGEQVLFLGNIPNVPGHCAVARYSGEVRWLVHPQDFRKAKEHEL